MEEKEWEEALACISRAVTCCDSGQPTAGLGVSYTNLGIILYQMDCYDKASEYMKKARACFDDISIEWGRTKEEIYSAMLELKLGKIQSALSHYGMACRYAGKDFSPETTAMLQEVYASLREVPGAEPERPPVMQK